MKHLTLIALLLLAGCSNNTAKENLSITRTNTDGSSITLQYRGEVAQWLIAYFTTTKRINAHTPLSGVTVGQIDSEPDPNSISAVGALAGGAIKAIIK